jgi:hypothetical protein
MFHYAVTFGTSTRVFATKYHAEQFARALSMNGTQHTIKQLPRNSAWWV